jgi:hypothetical protein
VPDAQDQDSQPVILQRHDQPMVADAIPPEPRQFACQRLAEAAWILLGRDPLPQIPEDELLSRPAELSKLLGGGRIELDA